MQFVNAPGAEGTFQGDMVEGLVLMLAPFARNLERQGIRRTSSVISSISLVLVAGLLGCSTGRNYPDPAGPRYAGGTAVAPETLATELRVVSFNIEYALQMDSAIAVLTGEPALQNADVILLQEMNEKATRRVADTLGMYYVYYPSVYRYKISRDLGNAILSRWPIVEDRKIVLPHLSRVTHSQRAATAATIRLGETVVRVYSLHLGTMAGLSPAARRDQLNAVLEDARPYQHVVVGGDLNDAGLGAVARDVGYLWPTQRGPATTPVGRLDHILFKGFRSPDSAAAGTVLDNRGASDHLPIWAVGILH
jgi:endonuclease/exonuclease/phosphatase family metal-dependent hydrolase